MTHEVRKLLANNRGRTRAAISPAGWLQILADFVANATIEGNVAKPLTSFAEYPLRRVYPQAQSSVNQNKRLTA